MSRHLYGEERQQGGVLASSPPWPPRKTRGKTQHADQPSLKHPTEVFQAQQPSGLGLPRHHIKVHWQSVCM